MIRKYGMFKGHVFNFSDTSFFFFCGINLALKIIGKEWQYPKVHSVFPTDDTEKSNNDDYSNNHSQTLFWIWVRLGDVKHTEQVSTKWALKLELLNLGLRVKSPGSNYSVDFPNHGPP